MGVVSRKNPSGVVVYGIQWIDEAGQRKREFDRRWTRQDAKAALDEAAARLRDGVATRPELTVSELFDEWLANHVRTNCSPAYEHDARTQFRLRIEPMIGYRRIDTVTRRLVRQMVAQMKQVMGAREPDNEYAGHRSINKTLTVLKSMFTYAVQVEQLQSNPAHGVRELTEQPTRQIEAWPLETVHAVAQAAAGRSEELHEFQRGQRATWAGQRDYTLIMVAALTGLRQSELLGLVWFPSSTCR